ncbi:antichymotrypsin-2-like isoform X3 [Coccinella septempunctata]|uniref:antichymotrypsin-2-like isoform X3 n=1 Tax=Coccinella septempunctata TaxID=41139 RepID=UPI001D075398|nr:antichymotrypsin-2-like isoform X3 [Coccinella septempunctata]
MHESSHFDTKIPSRRVVLTVLSTLVAFTMGDRSELQVLQSNGQFSNNLYKILAENPGNVFFSPISAHAVLSMSYLGAEGSTKDAYVKSLALPDKETTANGYQQISSKLNNAPNVTLYMANKVYVSNVAKLKESFSKAVSEKFNSEVQCLNFAASAEAANTINKWVEQKTVNKIKNLISPGDLNSLTRLVLVNAIYFKGTWHNKFDRDDTRTEPFYLNENDKIDVQMMHVQSEFRYMHSDELKAKILEMPYTNQEFSMVIILPDERDGIKDLEAKLEKVDLTKITEGTFKGEVNVALPKFKIETTINMNEALDKLGLGEIFDSSADFSGMLEGKEALSVSKVIQKAFIEVNEEGAEAAAATEIQFVLTSAPMTNYFLADHPFIIILRQKTNILFTGRIGHPVSGDGNIAPKGEPVKDPFGHIINIKL